MRSRSASFADRKLDPKLVKLFKSKSPWEDKAIAEVRASLKDVFGN